MLFVTHRTSCPRPLYSGDGGNLSSSGGWLRVLGRSLSLRPDGADGSGAVADEIAAAAHAGDFAEAARLASVAASRRHGLGADASPGASLILQDTSSGKVLPPIAAANSSAVDATFLLPEADVPPGTYSVHVSNGYSTTALDSFVSPETPHQSTITVVSPADLAFASKTFTVADYGCGGGVNTSGVPINCTSAVLAAIAAAGANGGGTVLFGVGRWYVDGPLLLPDGVLLRGAGMDLTAIYFAENNKTTAPDSYIATAVPPAATASARGPRFGVEDLCIYVLSYYKNVIDVRVDTVGVRVRRVRVRANAFHCQSRSSEGGPGGGRAVNWTFMGGGFNPVVWIHGRNFEFSDCDIWGTWSIFHSSGPTGARHGLIRRNEIHNGGACHWFDNARQVIFDANTCIGNNPMTMGNNIDSYGGGFAHHVFIGNSDISQVWGNDREVMT